MPIYEYRCNRCNSSFSRLFLSLENIGKTRCGFCDSDDLTRLVSSFSLHQTEESRLSELRPSKPFGEDFYRDPRNVGLRAKQRLRQLGVDMYSEVGTKIEELVEKGRTGKILDEILSEGGSQ